VEVLGSSSFASRCSIREVWFESGSNLRCV
jgi:hypothetical protein